MTCRRETEEEVRGADDDVSYDEVSLGAMSDGSAEGERCLCCFVYLQVSKTRAAAMVTMVAMVTMAPTSTG